MKHQQREEAAFLKSDVEAFVFGSTKARKIGAIFCSDSFFFKPNPRLFLSNISRFLAFLAGCNQEESDVTAALGASVTLNVTLVCLLIFTKCNPTCRN